MRLTLTDEQHDLAAMLRELFTDSCPPALVRSMKEPGSDGYPAQLWTVLAKAGIFGLAVSPEYGGNGAGLYELGLVFTEAGRALCPTAVYNTLQFAVALQRLGTQAQRKRYLPPLVAGDLKATTQICDPSDAADTRPRLIAEGGPGGWVVSGTLHFVGNGGIADVLLVTARSNAFPETSGTVGLLVDPATDGVRITEIQSFAGDKQAKVEFDDVFAPEDAVLLGKGGNGLSSRELTWTANAIVALQCMEMVGGATAVLERTVDYVKMREQFNRPIASFQAAQHHVADTRIAIDSARLTASRATWAIGTGDTATRAVAIAKMQCSEAYKWTTLNAHQLHGGMGYVRETDLHLWSERAKVTEIQYGTADVAAGWLQTELGLLG